ncbi:hypothetical protein M011DRAFT_39435 [Sporormia fimetaria CBS 119925]|uniref:Uncharacterized protein n=1 Tax=Sporormia fimetaria CBS 119925 TaxID=1340428 RepID=A0A6A6VCB4_9PLEO|nr:hypothetical protein M011DRAFT_39435 [Sporormia fimetaria CBS 119925]
MPLSPRDRNRGLWVEVYGHSLLKRYVKCESWSTLGMRSAFLFDNHGRAALPAVRYTSVQTLDVTRESDTGVDVPSAVKQHPRSSAALFGYPTFFILVIRSDGIHHPEPVNRVPVIRLKANRRMSACSTRWCSSEVTVSAARISLVQVCPYPPHVSC